MSSEKANKQAIDAAFAMPAVYINNMLGTKLPDGGYRIAFVEMLPGGGVAARASLILSQEGVSQLRQLVESLLPKIDLPKVPGLVFPGNGHLPS